MSKIVYLMAQGEGSRWQDRRKHARFAAEAPLYKQLLEINGEPILRRSARLFSNNGFEVVVIAGPELLELSGCQEIGITLENPGTDLLVGVLAVMELESHSALTVIAHGDVIYSPAAINKLTEAIEKNPVGCMARAYPSKVCTKVADEVFAIWFYAEEQSWVAERLRYMLYSGPTPRENRPSSPWGFPSAVSTDLARTKAAYATGLGLKAVEGDLLLVSDYTDDIDSPEEWLEFWDDLLAAANENRE